MCIFCKGKLSQDVTDYVENTGSNVFVIKEVPCEKCNQCGETYFNTTTVRAIEHILSERTHKADEITLCVINYTKAIA